MNLLILKDGTAFNISYSDAEIGPKGEKKAYELRSTQEWQFWQWLLGYYKMDLLTVKELFKRLEGKGITPKAPIRKSLLFYADFAEWNQFIQDLDLEIVMLYEDEVRLERRS